MGRRSRAGAAAAPEGDARSSHSNSRQPEVSVRMYRQGLGDCFLLTFPREGRPLYMLIDCGVLLGTQGQDEQMKRVADNIRETTKGEIDVLGRHPRALGPSFGVPAGRSGI